MNSWVGEAGCEAPDRDPVDAASESLRLGLFKAGEVAADPRPQRFELERVDRAPKSHT